MTPYYISCTTCKARLKVRDESAVGEIHTCPRCGSMVLITPPRAAETSEVAADSRSGELLSPAATAAAPATLLNLTFDDAVEILGAQSAAPPAAEPASNATSAPSVPATARSIDYWADTVDEVPTSPEVEAPVEETATPTRFAQSAPQREPSAVDVRTETADEVTSAADEHPAEDHVTPELVDEAAENAYPPPLLPGEQWISPTAMAWRQWVIYGGAAAVGIGLAIGVFGFAVIHTTRANRSAVSEAAHAAETTSANSALAAVDPAVVDDAPSPVEPKPPIVAEPEMDAALPDSQPENPAASPSANHGAASSEQPGRADAEEATPPAPLDTENAAEESVSPQPIVAEVASNGDLLDKFGDFLGGAAYVAPAPPPLPIASEEGPTDSTSPEDAAQPPTAGSEEPSAESAPPRPAPRVVDVAARLSDPVIEIELPSLPLGEFLSFVSDLSTIPITLEPEAMAWRRLSVASPVTVSQTDTTVEGILSAALAPLDLGYVVEDGHLLITAPTRGDSRFRTIKHPVEDLAGNDAQRIKELSELIRDFVAPESWKARGGLGSLEVTESGLTINQTEAIHYRVIAFCETLRTARGMPLRTRFDASRFRPQAPQQAIRAKLATPITLNYRQPTNLTAILNAFGNTAGVTILVDWRAAADAGWGPEAKGSVVADGLTLGEALTQLLTPMDLAYRVVDGSTLQVTTPEILRTRVETVLYPVGDLLDGKLGATALLERIRKDLGETNFGDEGGALHVDQSSKHLIAALPQPKQSELATLLESLRAP